MKLHQWLFIITVFALPFTSQGQTDLSKETLTQIGFHFSNPKKSKFNIKFELYNNLIVIPIKINNSDTLNFILDSGVGYTLVTDPVLKLLPGSLPLRSVKVTGAAGEEDLDATIVQVNSIRLGPIASNKQSLVILDKEADYLSQYAGIKIHGLIGYDLLNRFPIKINYRAKLLTIYHPKRFKPKNKWERFPITIEQMKPYVQAEAHLDDQKKIPVKLILDTGAGHSLSLERGSHPQIKVPENNIPAQIGMTLNGVLWGQVSRINKFKMGGYEMQRVITNFPDTTAINHLRGLVSRQGNLGCGVLHRFHVILDYPHKRLVLKPNKDYKKPFQFNTSGIHLTLDQQDLSTFKVGMVRTGSPAFLKGIRPGDSILAIDNEVINGKNINSVYHLLNKKAGRKSLLIVSRNDKLYFVTLKLSEPI